MADLVVLSTSASGIATLTLNFPKKLNPLSTACLQSLHTHLLGLQADPSVRAIILGAEGRAFCAGHDLREVLDYTADDREALFALCETVMLLLPQLPQPVIAAVQGSVAAAGCQLAASCDMVVASEKAMFSTPGINVGFFCHTPGVALSRCIPQKHAFEMLTTGIPISAPVALQRGLVNRVVPDTEEPIDTPFLDSLRYQAAVELATCILHKPSASIQSGKHTFYKHCAAPDLQAAYAVASPVMIQDSATDIVKTGIQAFLAKRSPPWANTS
eukprot:NODE_3719_length_913_cov_26.652672_g3567_i0.p1 GENE.NODE_3719_length_913_cov_26.652672_g3567_i0~~NODE_3719_length_913_cov_26.652672_g3567_i0.p1  ORF type:complete len:272 (-),score=75.50 NODE_3719_length_913_cov_26.652672_g3567_i0:45-860(-)